jgi:hypothetical protein
MAVEAKKLKQVASLDLFAHSYLRIKQHWLRYKDGNGKCSCRDSNVRIAVPLKGSCKMRWLLECIGKPEQRDAIGSDSFAK